MRDRNSVSKSRVEYIGQEPREMALTGKVVQLLDSKVQVMILPMSAMFMLPTNPSGGYAPPHMPRQFRFCSGKGPYVFPL